MLKQVIDKAKFTDSYGVYWLKGENTTKKLGKGYYNENTKTIGLIRCPLCHKENYAMSVHSGRCAWCGFEANATTKDK